MCATTAVRSVDMKRDLSDSEWKARALRRGCAPAPLSSLKDAVGPVRFKQLLNVLQGKWRVD